jgi:hypothetical protein
MEKSNSFINHIEWLIMFTTLLGGFFVLDAKIDSCNSRFDQFMIAWHEESKDFHGRLIAIEERNKK